MLKKLRHWFRWMTSVKYRSEKLMMSPEERLLIAILAKKGLLTREQRVEATSKLITEGFTKDQLRELFVGLLENGKETPDCSPGNIEGD